MSVNLDLNEALNSAIKIYNDKKITIHQEGKEFPYITIKDDPSGNIKYCEYALVMKENWCLFIMKFVLFALKGGIKRRR